MEAKTRRGRLAKRMSAVTLAIGIIAAGGLVAASPAAAQSTVVIGSGNNVLGIAFEDANFTGASLIVLGANPGCTAPTTDNDFLIGVMPAGWNDEISSARGFGASPFFVCFWKFWLDGPNVGPSSDFSANIPFVGDFFNDEISAGVLT